MKKTILIFTFIILITSCHGYKNSNMSQVEKLNKEDINLIIDNWHKSASEANYENYFHIMDSSSVFIGTDASENWNKKAFSEFSKPYFDKGKAWDFIPLERNIYLSKHQNIVWFDELLKTWMGICRGSGVLEKNDNNIWKIKHYVLSITIPNNNIHKVFNINKEKDSVFLLKRYINNNKLIE